MNLSFPAWFLAAALASRFLAAALASTADAFNFKTPFGLDSNTESDANTNWSAVYAMTNQEKNEILVYSRDAGDGSLTYQYSVETGGAGLGQVGSAPGDPLAAQDPMVVAGQCLLALNAGSNTISTFHIEGPSVIRRVAFYATGGTAPVSVAEHDSLVYVLNSWGQGSIQGFDLDRDSCRLTHIGGAVELEQEDTGFGEDEAPNGGGTPSEIGFTPDGNLLVVIKVDGGFQNFPTPGISSLNHYVVSDDGSTSQSALTKITNEDRAGSVFFAFDFDTEGHLILAEVFHGGFPAEGNGSGGVSTWTLGADNTYTQVGDVTNTGQSFTCWVRFNPGNNCAYTTNFGAEGSISSLQLLDGTYTLKESVAAGLNQPLDVVASKDGHNLYVSTNAIAESSFGQTPAIHVYSMTSGSCLLTVVEIETEGIDPEFTETNGFVGLAVFPGNP